MVRTGDDEVSEPVCMSAKTLAKTEEFDETDWGVGTRTLGNSDGLGGPGSGFRTASRTRSQMQCGCGRGDSVAWHA